MTSEQKIGAGTLATVLAILTLVLSSQSLPVIQWAFGEFKAFAGLPLFAPVTMAVIVGAIAPAWLPHVLPACWPEHRTKRVTRLLGFGIAFLMVVGQYRSAIGAQYGLFAGSGAYMLWTMLASFVYRVVPQAKPPSMKTDDADVR
jgi:hypothetical protein